MSKKNSLANIKSLTGSIIVLALFLEICTVAAVNTVDPALGDRRELEESIDKTKKRSWAQLLLTYLVV